MDEKKDPTLTRSLPESAAGEKPEADSRTGHTFKRGISCEGKANFATRLIRAVFAGFQSIRSRVRVISAIKCSSFPRLIRSDTLYHIPPFVVHPNTAA